MLKFFKNLFSKSEYSVIINPESEYSVTINPEDFQGTSYLDNENCALATAMKRDPRFKGRDIEVGGTFVNIGDETYKFVSMNDIPFTELLQDKDLIVQAYNRIEMGDSLSTLNPIIVKFKKEK